MSDGKTAEPKRVQLKRHRRGSIRDAVDVSGSDRWSNRYQVNQYITPAAVVARYRFAVEHGLDGAPTADEIRANLAGRDLACTCPLDQPCHADVLLEVANGEPSDIWYTRYR